MPETPEHVFRMLKLRAGTGVSYLWSHQADILREYTVRSTAATDVALELPTGAGKTLVGVLLAEFRRRSQGQRVAYACPNVLLAQQVGDRATQYGIPAHVFTRRQADWDPASFMAYRRAQAVAITTYHSIFNTNPKLDDAQTLVLDDAHSAEGAVASMWSLTTERGEELYAGLRDTVSSCLPPAFAERLHDDDAHPRDRTAIEVVGPHELAPVADLIREVLQAHATGQAQYAIGLISNHVAECVLYISWGEVLLRPFIAPTQTHRAFAGAKQRIYKSATLGQGGELERTFGIPSIDRLPVPAGWEEHGSGRRFFMFPGAALDPADVDEFVRSAMVRSGRALVLAPSRNELDSVADRCAPADVEILYAADLEGDRERFIQEPRSILMAAGRYDGMDFADDACRLIVLSGLPSGLHLQERFLMERLNAQRVLGERLRTRIVQGAGRCTRNARDYAAVVVRGEALLDFLSRIENQTPLQPELQAEIEVGLRNSEEEGTDLLGLLDSFLKQDEDWIAADEYIQSLTSERPKTPSESSVELAASAREEVAAWSSAWGHDLDAAVTHARKAADLLEGGPGLRPYRAFWLYLAASWALTTLGSDAEAAHETALIEDAIAAARPLLWMPRLGTAVNANKTSEATAQSTQAAEKLLQMGLRGLRFEREVSGLASKPAASAASEFEEGLRLLGEILGFESIRPTGQAQPDGAWRDGTRAWLVFEAKTDADQSLPIPVADIRQALTHVSWLESNVTWDRPSYSMTYLITDRNTIDRTAAGIAGGLMVVRRGEISRLADEVIALYRSIRSAAPGMAAEELATRFAAELSARNLDTDSLATRLAQRGAARMAMAR